MWDLQPPRHISTLPTTEVSLHRTKRRFGPTPDSCTAAKEVLLFDHLVGKREQIRGQFKADRLRGLQVDHKQIFGRFLERQISRLGAPENPID